MQNQDTVFQQVWCVRVHLTPQLLQKLTVIGRSYSRTTRYPVCHDHTFTIVCEHHHLFHVRLVPLEFFRSRVTFASPLTGLRFQFRLEMPKWRERLCHYLSSVANVCISFEITLVCLLRGTNYIFNLVFVYIVLRNSLFCTPLLIFQIPIIFIK